MVDESPNVDDPKETPVIPVRTLERAEELADGLLDLLLLKVKNGTANASEMKEAREWIKEAGVKLVTNPGSKAGELGNVLELPDFEEEDEAAGRLTLNGKIIKTAS